MIVLDTNVISEVFKPRPDPRVVAWLESLTGDVSITTITLAEHYADIVVARERSGLPITMADAQIAAICRSRQASCATRNTKDFAETGVELLNPWVP